MTVMSASAVPSWLRPTSHDGWTARDLDELPDELRRVELVEGALHVSPPATNPHNIAATALAARLIVGVDAKWVVSAPGSVQLDARNVREPDVLVLLRTGSHAKHAHPSDVLLAVEVMSPSSVTEDRLVKPAHYARAGIPHYWRLEDSVLVTHALSGDLYVETGRFDDLVETTDPVALTFRLADLLG